MGWLRLAVEAAAVRAEEETVYMMCAERVIDANDTNFAGCDGSLEAEAVVERTKKLLDRKENRRIQDDWT